MGDITPHKFVASEKQYKHALSILALTCSKSVQIAREELQRNNLDISDAQVRLVMGILAIETPKLLEGSNESMDKIAEKMYEAILRVSRTMDGEVHRIKHF